MLKINFIIVSPSSPKWNHIGSIRWEKITKYLSYNHQVTMITSSFDKFGSCKDFDIGQAELIEVPLKYGKTNSHANNNENIKVEKKKYKNESLRSIKAYILPVLERFFPISSGGMLYHDFRRYFEEVEQRISKDNLFTVLITTYSPWFPLKLGDLMKKKYNSLLWVADFRDPSFNVPGSKISRIPFFKTSTCQKIKDADIVTVVSEQMKKEYEAAYKRKIFYLANGFDEVITVQKEPCTKEKHSLHIAYTGSLYPNTRDISYFVNSLKYAHNLQKDITFKFTYVGKDSQKVKDEFEKRDMQEILQNFGFVSHEEALEIQRNADVLLLIGYTGDDPKEGRGIRTGKVYEYLASCKPIIVIAPKDWEMKEEVECDGISKVFEKTETTKVAEYLIKLANIDNFEIDYEKRQNIINKYSYKKIANDLVEIINEVQRSRINENTFSNRSSSSDNQRSDSK